jgi:hypothetical protein
MRMTFQTKLTFLSAVTVMLTFMACKNNTSSKKEDPSVSEALLAKKTNIYHHFRGKIGETAITMDLVETKTAHELGELPQFNGYFSYDSVQEPLPISGVIDSAGTIKLLSSSRKSMDEFEGKFNADSTFTGVWRDTSKKAMGQFSLRETTSDGAIAMDVFTFEDSIKLFETAPNTPQASFSMLALLPARNTEETLFENLRTLIIKELNGDSVPKDYKYLQILDVQKSARDSFFHLYKNELKDEKTDALPSEQLNYSQTSTMEVVSNTDGLLTLAYKSYNYTGGAHGNYGTQFRTYDIKTKKQLTLDDLFKPNYKTTSKNPLNAAIMRAARNHFGAKPNESLQSYTLVDAVEANDNFAITRKGIMFNYTPYEIASYAEGEIQLFIPFEALKSILK